VTFLRKKERKKKGEKKKDRYCGKSKKKGEDGEAGKVPAERQAKG